MLIAAGIFLAGAGAPKLLAASPRNPELHVVRSGETLWALARVHAPDGDPRQFVDAMRRLNRLSTVKLFPGQTLVLPD